MSDDTPSPLNNVITIDDEQCTAKSLDSTWGPSVSWWSVSEPIRSLPHFSALPVLLPITIAPHHNENVRFRAARPFRPVRFRVKTSNAHLLLVAATEKAIVLLWLNTTQSR